MANNTFVNTAVRRDFLLFLKYAISNMGLRITVFLYIEMICAALQQLSAAQIKRAILNLPPRHLKTTLTVFFIAWELGRSPNLEILVVVASEGLAREIADGVRTILRGRRPFRDPGRGGDRRPRRGPHYRG